MWRGHAGQSTLKIEDTGYKGKRDFARERGFLVLVSKCGCSGREEGRLRQSEPGALVAFQNA